MRDLGLDTVDLRVWIQLDIQQIVDNLIDAQREDTILDIIKAIAMEMESVDFTTKLMTELARSVAVDLSPDERDDLALKIAAALHEDK